LAALNNDGAKVSTNISLVDLPSGGRMTDPPVREDD